MKGLLEAERALVKKSVRILALVISLNLAFMPMAQTLTCYAGEVSNEEQISTQEGNPTEEQISTQDGNPTEEQISTQEEAHAGDQLQTTPTEFDLENEGNPIEENEEYVLPDGEIGLLATSLASPSKTDVDPEYVFDIMQDYFSNKSCKNTSTTDVTTFWAMLAKRALDIPESTKTKYGSVDYSKLNAQVLSKFIISMVNDGVDPAFYGIKDQSGNITTNVVELLKSYYDADTGGYHKTGQKAAVNHQAFVLMALAICDVEIPEAAGKFFTSSQNENGILASAWGTDMDTTSWAIIGCNVAGVPYENQDKALSYMEENIDSMNANTLGCYLNCLAYLDSQDDEEHLTENHMLYQVNTDRIYSSDKEGFLYNGTVNALANQQSSIPLGEYINAESLWDTLDGMYTYDSEGEILPEKTATVTVRVADAKSVDETKDLVKRTELEVVNGAWERIQGKSVTCADPTYFDALTEAAYYSIYDNDPTVEDLENDDYQTAVIKLLNQYIFAEGQYGYAIIEGTWGFSDSSWGYYKNGNDSAWSLLSTIEDGDDVFFFHYDYLASNYAFFDRAEYSMTTDEAATVTVKQLGYDLSWKPVFTGIPAQIQIRKNGSIIKTYTANVSGEACLVDLSAGQYEITASYTDPDTGMFIVSPYAELTVENGNEVPNVVARITVRVSDAKSSSETEDMVKRTELVVNNGSWCRVQGKAATPSYVTYFDALVEAAYYSIYETDPQTYDLENATKSEAVRNLLNDEIFTEGQYGYAIVEGTWGFSDSSWGYYKNGNDSAWSLLSAIEDGDDVFFFHYDYLASNYAFFDRAEYSMTTDEAATVTVKQLGYDLSWKPVFTGIPAQIQIRKNGSIIKTYTANVSGEACLVDLSAGQYEITASYTDPDTGMFVVSPYATLTVAEGKKATDKKVTATVRVSDVSDAGVTKDLVKNTKLEINNGSWEVIQGKNPSSSDVTYFDALVEAAYYSIYHADPSPDNLRDTIKTAPVIKLLNKDIFTEGQYGYGFVDGTWGFSDNSWGYYKNGNDSAWNLLSTIESGDDVFFFHYDYTASNYAFFDKAEYFAFNNKTIVVEVKAASYDTSWNPVVKGVPATITIERNGKTSTVVADAQGKAQISGLKTGSYSITANYTDPDTQMSIVAPYAQIIIAEGEAASVSKSGTGASDMAIEASTQELEAALLTDFSDKEIEAIVAGNAIKIEYKVVAKASPSVSAGDRSKIEAAMPGSTVAKYMAITFTRKIGTSSTKTITTAAEAIKQSIELPSVPGVAAGYQRNWNIIYLHDGIAKTLPVSVEGNRAVFASSEYSLYALAYEDTLIQTEPVDKDQKHYAGSANSYGGSGTSAINTTIDKILVSGIDSKNAVSGIWQQNPVTGVWTFIDSNGVVPKNQWVMIKRSYAGGSYGVWYYFDAAGNMLTGWQKIKGLDGRTRWYYFGATKDALEGGCYLNCTTPDGYDVDSTGAWNIKGVVQYADNEGPDSQADQDVLADATSALIDGVLQEAYDSEKSSGSNSGTKNNSTGNNHTEGKDESAFSVSISITTSKAGNPFNGSGSYKVSKGSNVFEVLVELCEDKGWDIEGDGGYVSAINGLGEFDHGSQSGWMYKVNGKYPNIPCGDYQLNKNDKIVWVYVTEMQPIEGE